MVSHFIFCEAKIMRNLEFITRAHYKVTTSGIRKSELSKWFNPIPMFKRGSIQINPTFIHCNIL